MYVAKRLEQFADREITVMRAIDGMKLSELKKVEKQGWTIYHDSNQVAAEDVPQPDKPVTVH